MESNSNNHKLIFTGPVGVGKTTAIGSISDIEIIRTDESATDMTAERKPQTTVAMDYGMMKLEGGARVHLYGTPGQERFSFMWDILSVGALGLVLLLDNTRPNPHQDMKFYLNAFGDFLKDKKFVIGVTQTDLSPDPELDFYHEWLQGLGYNAPIFQIDARKGQDVSMLVQALLFSIDPELTEK